MITPLPWARMTGRACLQARTTPRKLTAMIRSKASVEISVTGASPPVTLIPTLLWRISSRPRCSLQWLTAASRLASSTTSAATASPCPPSRCISSTVSCAESMSRSTASTWAPSRANSNAVARPLPMVGPGVWPAPTTIAILLFSRISLWSLDSGYQGDNGFCSASGNGISNTFSVTDTRQ